jgi:hypothetical protein
MYELYQYLAEKNTVQTAQCITLPKPLNIVTLWYSRMLWVHVMKKDFEV